MAQAVAHHNKKCCILCRSALQGSSFNNPHIQMVVCDNRPGERVRVSLHLEKQGVTDAEAELLAAWYKVSNK